MGDLMTVLYLLWDNSDDIPAYLDDILLLHMACIWRYCTLPEEGLSLIGKRFFSYEIIMAIDR